MSLVAAGVLGIVVGYGLALWRESRRVQPCERTCAALREHRRVRLHQDVTISELFRENDKLARMLMLQAACDKTRFAAHS